MRVTEELESILGALIDAHRELVACGAEQRAALRKADPAALEQVSARTELLLTRIAELESRRRELTPRIDGSLAPGAPLAVVCRSVKEPERSRLTSLGAALRPLVEQCRAEQAVLRAAARSLLAHLDGLMKQVARTLSPTRIYGPRGTIDQVGPSSAALDVRS